VINENLVTGPAEQISFLLENHVLTSPLLVRIMDE
jgi:hypothetical protein